MMIQVNPNNRPGCDELLSWGILSQKMKKMQPEIYTAFLSSDKQSKDKLLKTIYVPKFHNEDVNQNSQKSLKLLESQP